jgi:hypothetical protein
MRYLGTLLLLVCFSALASAQLLVDDFNYGALDSSDISTLTSKWVRHSGAQGPTYVAAGLTYAGYASSGIGGCIGFTHGSSGTNDGDVHEEFATDVTITSTVYASFLVNVSASGGADYFFHLGPATLGTCLCFTQQYLMEFRSFKIK